MTPEKFQTNTTCFAPPNGHFWYLRTCSTLCAGLSQKPLDIGSAEIAPALSIIFQSSLDNGEVPLDWKDALVAPLFKEGDRSQPANYRPMSLTSICSKIMEHIIHHHTITFFEQHDILQDTQHGFRKRRSCESQLVLTVHDLATGLNNNSQIGAVLLDFSKAFDRVPHQRFLHKLSHYGVRNNILQWIGNFLNGRSQQVVCEGKTSTPVRSRVESLRVPSWVHYCS